VKQDKSSHAPAVDRALDVIEFMATSERDLSLARIRERLNIPRQSLVGILNTLRDRGIASTPFSFELEDRNHLGEMVGETAGKISYRMGKER